ncbi:NTP transferase domain-containing protein [Sphingomonas jatrophae]|uniref:Bifunctional UDP-N-acetylglucosamine pyrophosphorylase / Glucosamine-1-phosphate N-acetyltransferase n=1 Tax=Sphingomonas jatrophae TaxID=1166337 RepID=A0A1I6L6S6_9SPHN|nr:NTP transferase domain-containing protein [Sphingomonas jatrophae]SFR98960.1 bifunctional UDP-N-acetylglucosamine pyrophosphorylase / Glucosamine-1-phosphate N-acetyltransferase [Sphingomonas jatrophae]
MADLRVLIAAAGAGTRAGLPYPKTLHPAEGRPILGRLLDVLGPYDPAPTIIVSPAGRDPIAAFLNGAGMSGQLVEQAVPTGMGDAVLRFEDSPAAAGARTVLLAWGDIPYLSAETIAATLAHHRQSGAALTFPSARVDRAYTVVSRDADGRVVALDETRGRGVEPGAGERDIGLFVFEAAPVLAALRASAAAHDRAQGEHGFLQIVCRLAEDGHRIEALPIATPRELISLNALADLEGDA